jgi:hypothetical protein
MEMPPVNRQGEVLLAQASEAFDRLQDDIAAGKVEIDDLKSLRVLARSALDWLEDTPEFEVAHRLLDRIGRLARTVFPKACVLEYQDDGQYYDICPVSLAHSRVGMSIAYVIKKAECGICGRDPWNCMHIKGRVYDGQVCTRRILDAEVIEMSIVSRPAHPDARFLAMSVDRRDLRESLGEAFQPGVVVNCDRCLSHCRGVNRAFEAAVSPSPSTAGDEQH